MLSSLIDLTAWYAAAHEKRKAMLQHIHDQACAAFDLPIRLSFTMPEGYELANGLSDPATGDIRINEALWQQCDPIEPLFFFVHELRHSMQSVHPEDFAAAYALNSRYVLQFDGTAYKFGDHGMQTVQLSGSADYFVELYLASPCERDANTFAYQVLKAAGAKGFIDTLYAIWTPKYTLFAEKDALTEYLKAVAEIDRLIAE